MNEYTSTQTLRELMDNRDMFNGRIFSPSSDAILSVGYSDNPKFVLEMNLSVQEMSNFPSGITSKLFHNNNPAHAWYATKFNINPSVMRILQREFKQKVLDALNLDSFGSDSEADFSLKHLSGSVPVTLFSFSFKLDTIHIDAPVRDLLITAVREFFAPIVDMFEREIRSGKFFHHVIDLWHREENSVNNPKEAFLSMCNENIAQLNAGVS